MLCMLQTAQSRAGARCLPSEKLHRAANADAVQCPLADDCNNTAAGQTLGATQSGAIVLQSGTMIASNNPNSGTSSGGSSIAGSPVLPGSTLHAREHAVTGILSVSAGANAGSATVGGLPNSAPGSPGLAMQRPALPAQSPSASNNSNPLPSSGSLYLSRQFQLLPQ